MIRNTIRKYSEQHHTTVNTNDQDALDGTCRLEELGPRDLRDTSCQQVLPWPTRKPKRRPTARLRAVILEKVRRGPRRPQLSEIGQVQEFTQARPR